jgi:GT2 family glycosyltransferase
VNVSVMITTKNRVGELRRVCEVLRQLNPSPLEILITADGCTDETVAVVKSESRNAKLIVNETGLGSVASRDRMMREARGDLVLALDDDSYPEAPDCLRTLSDLFSKNARLAVATFPQRTDEYPNTLAENDFGRDRLVRSFANSGACLRVSTYRSLPGFEPMFFHMYEEPDFALQCVADGWDVRFFPQITVRHHYTGKERSELRNHQRHARNELWSTIMRCPFPFAIAIAGWRVCSQFGYACKRGWPWIIREPFWWWEAVKGIPAALRKRRPVSWNGYRRWLTLAD